MNKSMHSCAKVLSLISILSSANAMALTPETRFKNAGTKVARALMAKGSTRFGALILRDYVRFVNSSAVQLIQQSPDQIERRNGDGRRTARWETTRKGSTIWFDPNFDAIRELAASAPILTMHDYLGTYGFNDRRYIPSLGMWFLTQAKPYTVLKAHEISQIESIIARKLENRSARGGIIGVGGGGQIMTVHYRGGMMLRCLDYFKQARTSADRVAVMDALIQLWTEPDEVIFRGGKNPWVEFTLKP